MRLASLRRTHLASTELVSKMALVIGAPATLVVRAAKHVNPKATKHHTKTRPKKVRRLARKIPSMALDRPQNPEPSKMGRVNAPSSVPRGSAAASSHRATVAFPSCSTLLAVSRIPATSVHLLANLEPSPADVIKTAPPLRPQPQAGRVPRDQGGGDPPAMTIVSPSKCARGGETVRLLSPVGTPRERGRREGEPTGGAPRIDCGGVVSSARQQDARTAGRARREHTRYSFPLGLV